jgi:ribonuclease HII
MSKAKVLLAMAGAQIAGVDEAGRGPLSGSVFAAAVMLDPARPFAGLRDSKQLTAVQRMALEAQIQINALAYCVASAVVQEIDTLNILQATLLAMQRAVQGLAQVPDAVWVDGNRAPRLGCQVKTIIQGDATVAEIAAASILAKCARDREAVAMDAHYPGYGFAQHKGYGTAQHLQALRALGPCPEHRKSFAPVRALLQAQEALTWLR